MPSSRSIPHKFFFADSQRALSSELRSGQKKYGDCSPALGGVTEMVIPRVAMLLAVLLFLGYVMIWCVIPLDVWLTTWLPTMLMQTKSKYFGVQGTFMVIFTIPIICVALLGCVYLHLTRNAGQYDGSVKRNRFAAAMKKPMLVRGALGVVSATEILFLLMFTLLILWSFVYVEIRLPVVENMNARQNRRHANDELWLQKLRSVAFYFATVANLSCAYLFVPVTRFSSILGLAGLTAEGSVKYHIWVGHFIMFCYTSHGLLFFIYWAITHDLVEMTIWDHNSVSNVPGEIALLIGLVLWATTHPRIRRRMYELFFYAHQLYVPFMFFYILHVGFHFFCMILPGFYLYLVDRYLRFLQSRRKVRLVSARVLPCDAVELNFSKCLALNYTPTSFVSINIPALSSLQWHSYSVSSNAGLEPDRISVIVKKDGGWSQKVIDTVSAPSPADRLEVAVEGPYGPASTDFLRHETLVLIAGGSGISPMISVIRELIFRKAKFGTRTPKVVLICAFKHAADLTLLNLVLPLRGISMDVSQLDLEIEAFVTRDKQAAIDDLNRQVKTIWFKPHASDEAVSAILGPHTWLCLGAIILSSFVMYAAIIGLLGRYYIYPIDKNTLMFYSWTSRACLNMLFVCVSIIATATAAVLWNKRKNGMVGSESIHSTTLETDLESLPRRSIMDNTRVHFGQRPNLKEMLLRHEGSSTGVLVCGPGSMRHEVARICSSCSSGDLHYESISYTS